MLEPAIAIAAGLLSLMFKVFIIVMPLMLLLEWARTQTWFSRFVDSSGRVFSPIGFRGEALLPLMAGVLFGITYGAGVLIPKAQSGEMSTRQVFLVAAFLGLCHAMVEDTLLFVALGANPWILAGVRIAAAMLVVYIFSRLPWPAEAATRVSAPEGASND